MSDKKSKTVNQTWIFPDGMSQKDRMKIVQGDLTRIHEEAEKERWFKEEVRRRGLDRRGLLASLLGF